MKQNFSQWIPLIELSMKLFRLKPWDFILESDIFAIESPYTGKIYYISAMGRLGETLALSAYEGDVALSSFWRLRDTNTLTRPEDILNIPHYMISWEIPDFLFDEQLEIHDALLTPASRNGRRPQITRIVPGFAPYVINNEEIEEIECIISQSIQVIKRLKLDDSILFNEESDDDEYLFRLASKSGEKWTWRDEYRLVPQAFARYTFSVDQQLLEIFMKLPAILETVQIDIITFPRGVIENERTIFPTLLLIVHAKTGVILHFMLIKPEPDYEGMINELPNRVMESFIEFKRRPTRITYRTPPLTEAMRLLASKAKFKAWYTEKMPHMDEAIDHSLNFI
ncbi:MAG: hypothetical protein Q7J34_14530 [Bacteroidales bacterium]|nr:hypothetical protein [Bacteroidales bacterium]